jgi:4-amino-4-deoxy-L-arabinose transferase-like glycosyltransferase
MTDRTLVGSDMADDRAGRGRALRAVLLALLCIFAFVPGITTLPPTDRDESRYVQATKQMVETGDYVDIRLQEDSRYKKPIGIYWLQSAYVQLSGQGTDAPLWIYRLVSVTGGIVAVLLTFWVGCRMFGMRAGTLASLGMMGIIALGFEARIAKTDAMLLATALGAQAALASIYLADRRGEATGPWLPWAFWIAQGLGILVKGPIVPLLSALTVAAILVFDRDRSWIRKLKAGRGILIAIVIALPWLALITYRSGMDFWRESVGNDLLGKVVEGQESHGFPPGYYFITYSLFMWPFAAVALEGGLKALNRFRNDPRLLFLLAWYLPFWLFFELLPTKLPHYVLPAYPALLLLMAWSLTDPDAAQAPLRTWQKWLWRAAALGAVVVTLALAVLAVAAVPYVTGSFAWWGIPAAALILLAGWLGLDPRGTLAPDRRVAGAAVSGAAALGILSWAVIPALTPVWLSPQIADRYAELRPCPDSVLVSAGYHEPSLVFLAGTRTRLVYGGEAARALMNDPSCGIAVVNNHNMESFTAALPEGLDSVRELGRIEGFNYSKGDPLTLIFYGAAAP